MLDPSETVAGIREWVPFSSASRTRWDRVKTACSPLRPGVHPAVARVYFPGLPSHPGHEIARLQQQGFGAMVSFELKGSVANVKALLARLHLFSLAESLGGVESLVAHPASMTHAAMDETAQIRAGISSTLVRVSVGIEEGDDLARDLATGLDAAMRCSAS